MSNDCGSVNSAPAALNVQQAPSTTLTATFNTGTDVPLTCSGLTATGNTVNFSLNYAPAPGTELMVVQNTGLDFIQGTFDNLAQGQAVTRSYGGTSYNFVANYYGGSGGDLVLVWANNRVFAWGYNGSGQLGDNSETQRQLPVPVTGTGVLAGKTVWLLRQVPATASRYARTVPWPPGATTGVANSATAPRRIASCQWQ